jgi:hypothetical protein
MSYSLHASELIDKSRLSATGLRTKNRGNCAALDDTLAAQTVALRAAHFFMPAPSRPSRNPDTRSTARTIAYPPTAYAAASPPPAGSSPPDEMPPSAKPHTPGTPDVRLFGQSGTWLSLGLLFLLGRRALVAILFSQPRPAMDHAVLQLILCPHCIIAATSRFSASTRFNLPTTLPL